MLEYLIVITFFAAQVGIVTAAATFLIAVWTRSKLLVAAASKRA